MAITITLPELLTTHLQKEAQDRQISLDELVTEALTRMFMLSDEGPEIEAVIAEIKALPPDPSHVHPARQSLAELLRNAPEAPDFDLATWQQAWARIGLLTMTSVGGRLSMLPNSVSDYVVKGGS